MLEAIKYSESGEKIGKVSLNKDLFDVTCDNPKALMYEVINMYLANQRQGTSAVKNRAAVKGSSAKLFRQKGTGNARMGTRRSPLRVGGGNAFGPQPKDWYSRIPKKKKRLALKIALSAKAKNGEIMVIEKLNFDKPDTKAALELINKIIPEKGRKLIVIDGSDKGIIKSFSNIGKVSLDRADLIYPYEILKNKYILFSEDALRKVEEVFGK